MGIQTGQRQNFLAWYHQLPANHTTDQFWDVNGWAARFAVYMPDGLSTHRFQWTYDGGTKVFKAVRNHPGFPVPSTLDFSPLQGQQHILQNPLDPTIQPLSEALVCRVKSEPGNGNLFHQFVEAEIQRYSTPQEIYSGAERLAKTVLGPHALWWGRRFRHHLHYKHADSLMRHLGALDAQTKRQMVTRQQLTEVRGEFAAAKFAFLVLAKSANDYHLKLGMDSPYTQGIDQIWVRRDASSGDVREYVLVEAKGSRAAKLGQTVTKGHQMSPRWAMASIKALRDHRGHVTRPNVDQLTTKIMKAMLGVPPDPRLPHNIPTVWGLVVHLRYSNTHPTFEIEVTDANVFNVDT